MNSCARLLRWALASHGGWVGRAELGRTQVGVDYSEGRVDDELADLVVAGSVLFNERGRQYRLAGEPMARRALRELLKGTQRAHVLCAANADKTAMRVGVALRGADADADLVMAEFELPHHGGDPTAMAHMVRAFAGLADTAAFKAAAP